MVKEANPTVTINRDSYNKEVKVFGNIPLCTSGLYKTAFEGPLNVVAVGESQVGIVEIFLVKFLLY